MGWFIQALGRNDTPSPASKVRRFSTEVTREIERFYATSQPRWTLVGRISPKRSEMNVRFLIPPRALLCTHVSAH
jgi:hypothetical protein